MQRLRVIVRRYPFLLTIGLLLAGNATAHHSQAPYDMTTEVVIEGTIVDLEWRNPHIAMTLEVVGQNGDAVLREVELASVSELRALGVDESTIPLGSRVALQAHPSRRGPQARVFGLGLTTTGGMRIPLHPFAGFANRSEVSIQATSLAGRWAPSGDGLTEVFGAFMNWPYTDAARASLGDAVNRPGESLGVCADYPPPLLSIFPDLREIEIDDASVVMHFEAQGQNLERLVRMNVAEHPADVEPSLLGHSIGWWVGETLVVDTVAFTPHPHGAFAWVGSGPDKHLVERFTLADDRLHLRYDFTMEDPESLTQPGTLSMAWDYRPDLEPSGVACDPEIAERLLHEE